MKWIVVLRKQQGLSQKELARQIGIVQSHLCNLETGKFPLNRVNYGAVKALERVLGMDIDTLLTDITAPLGTVNGRFASMKGV